MNPDNIICNSHTAALIAKIRYKGMASLVHPERAGEFAKRWLEGTAPAGEFDPYVVSVLEIAKKASELMGGKIPGCAVCRAAQVLQRADLPEMWIENVTDLMYLVCKTNGLIKGEVHA